MKSFKKMLLVVLAAVMMISGSALVASAAGSVKKTSITTATATAASVNYTGKAQSPSVTVTLNGVPLRAGTDYVVEALSAKNAGKYTVTIKGIGQYEGTITTTFTVKPAEVSLTNKSTATQKVVYTKSAVKAKKQTIQLNVKTKKKVTYSTSKTPKKLKKYIKVNKKGKVTLKKGAKKGVYKVTVKYGKKTKTVKIKVK